MPQQSPVGRQRLGMAFGEGPAGVNQPVKLLLGSLPK
jgi:hypothetical protein